MERPAEPATPAHGTAGPVPEVLTAEQAATLLQVSAKTLKRLGQADGFPARRVGNQWRFSRAALMDWLAGKDP